jgi:hypothetical protein
MSQPGVKVYEVSQVRSNTMPLSPFAGPYEQKPRPTSGIPGTAHAFNTETLNEGAEPGQQGTQMDALGHFAALRQAWDGNGNPPVDDALYYGGFTQKEVKPTPESPLLRLGMDKAPPIVTSAVLLDAMAHVGKGQPMKAGELVTSQHIQEMLKAQGLGARGILPGDVVYVHTGWGELWRDPDSEKAYYSKAPGLSYDAARYLGERRVVAIGLDTPFIDPVPEACSPARRGRPPARPTTCRLRCTTTCSRRWGSTTSRTPSWTRWCASACGPRAPSSCRFATRARRAPPSARSPSGCL